MLTAALIMTSVPMMTLADAGDPVYYGKDNYVYELSADPDTGTVPSGFGTAAYNGKIWTDKSVAVNTAGTGFDVNLKALAQEYVSTASSARTQETLADVLFILDFTTSMNGNDVKTTSGGTETRIEALVDAFNQAADIICANGKNRISVYGFGGNSNTTKTVQMLTKGNYEPGKNGDYLTVDITTGRNPTYTVKTAEGLKKDGAAATSMSQSLINYTSTQYGIANSATGFISDIGADTSTAARKPYVIFMTDGAATDGSKQYDNTAANIRNPNNTYKLTTTEYTNGTAQIAAAAILTANVWKDKIQAAYDTYNTKNGHEIKELDWFNIGLSIGTSNINARAVVDPATLQGHTQSTSANNGDGQGKVKYYMNDLENNSKVNSTTPKYYANDDYLYYTHDYVYFCDTTTLLNSAFEDLARLVESESAAINIPIVTNEASGDVSSDMVFKDYVGKGMEANGFTITVNGSEAVTGNDDDSDGVYTFEGYETTVTVSNDGDNQLVEWNLPAAELAMFTFKDRRNLNNGEYESATPSVLSYSVKLKDGVTLEDYADYSTVTNAVTSNNGARTTVEYSIPGDNTYYFDVTNTTDAEGKIVFDNSTLKTSVSENLNKTSNVTSTASAAKTYSYDARNSGTEDSLCNVTGALGNNGKIKLILKTEKTVDKTESATNKTVTYTTTVTNFSDDDHDVTLEDIFNTTKTDTTTVTYQDGSVDGGDSTDIVKEVTVTGAKDDVINGNDPIVKFVDDYAVNYDEDEDTPKSNDELDVTIIEPRFKITYEWTNAPSSATLPTDNNTYVETASFPVDSTYTSSSKVETKNSYGNVTERWTFSGWNSITIDAQDDAALTGEHKMPESDITIHGTWTYTSIIPDKYNITYVFEGDYPEGKSPAADSNYYEQNQPFGVSEAPYSDVNDLDEYGNVKGVWSFDGWDDITIDAQDGAALTGEHKMPASNITIHGTWTYTPQTINEYGVTYVFDKFTPDGTSFPSSETSVPTDANTYVNGQSYNVADEEAIADIPVYDEFGNKTGNWTFEGWYKATKGTGTTEVIDGKIPDDDVVIHGEWKYTENTLNTYGVTYVFDSVTPEGKTIPVGASSQLPTDSKSYVNNEPFTEKTGITDVPVYDEYNNKIGTWSFDGWYKVTKGTGTMEVTNSKIPDDDVVIHGKWRYTETTLDTYSVTYVFDSVTPSGKALPAEASNQLPTDSNSYVNNQPFTAASGITNVPVFDEYDNQIGTWKFDGWYKTTKGTGETEVTDGKIPADDVVIHGAWTYDEITLTKYKVTYVFDGEAPSEAVVPAVETGYVNNQPFGATKTYSDISDLDEYGNVKGVWSFEGWYKTTKDTDSSEYTGSVIPASDVTIHGKWSYTQQEIGKHSVIWVFDGEAPDETLPSAVTDLVNGQDIPADETFKTGDTHTDYTVYGNPEVIWTFDGWYKTTVNTDNSEYTDSVMPDANLTIHGKWTKTPQTVEKYNVSYVFDGEAPEDAVPPTDSAEYENNQPYTVADDPETVTEYDEYGNVTDVWTFEGWNKTTKNTADGEEYTGETKIPDADLVIHGTWDHQTIEVPEHKVVYSFVDDAPEGVVPPTDENTYVKGQSYTVADVPEDVPTYDEYGNQNGNWTCGDWNDPNGGVMGEQEVSVTATWTFTPQEVADYGVTYVFDTEAPEGKTVPTESRRYVKNQPFDVLEGFEDVDVFDEYGNVIGTWTWLDWYKVTNKTDTTEVKDGKMPASDIVIHGKWNYTGETLDTYKVTYVFDSVIPAGKTLPSEASSQLPTDSASYVNNQPFTAASGITDVPVYDEYNNLIGTWEFNGWYKTTKGTGTTEVTDGKIPDDDVVIHGEWEYDEETLTEYKVTYVFDGEAPTEAELPAVETGYVNNQPFGATKTYSDISDLDEYGNVKGVWSFEGWYKTTKDTDSSEYTGSVIPASDVTIHGKWKYTQQEIGKHSVQWVFDGEAPDEVLPSTVLNLVKGQAVPADETFKTGDTHTDYTEYGNPEVVWTFDGWYKTTANADGSEYTASVMPDGDLTIHGKWTKTPQTVEKYNVSYVFDGEAPSSAVLPTDSADYENNQPYTVADDLESITDYDEFGNVTDVWTFDGWNKTTKNTADGEEYTGEEKIPGADIVIHGTWTRDKKEVPTHTVTVPEDPQDPESPVIEKEVTNGATIIVDPNSGIWEHDGETYDESTNITVEEDIDLENPTREDHTFTGWTITETDDGIIKYTAEWDITNRDVTFTPTEDGDDPEGEISVPKGSIITIDPNGGEWTHGGETYTGKTSVTIDDDTVIEDPTRKGYDFTGWEKTVDEDGNITLTATWEKKSIDICKYIVPTAIIGGGITAGAIAGGITTAIVAGSIIGVPAVIIGGAAIYKAIKDNQSQDNTETEPSDIPYTGSDITVTLMASAMAIISMVAAAYIILENKKKRQSAE